MLKSDLANFKGNPGLKWGGLTSQHSSALTNASVLSNLLLFLRWPDILLPSKNFFRVSISGCRVAVSERSPQRFSCQVTHKPFLGRGLPWPCPGRSWGGFAARR